MSLIRRVKSLFGKTGAGPEGADNRDRLVTVSDTVSGAFEKNQEAAELFRRQGNAALQLGQLDNALSCYERFAALQPENAAAHLNIGYTLFSLGRFVQAETVLQRSLQLDPASHEAHYFLGCAKAERGDLVGATVSLSQAVALAPGFDAGWMQLGHIQERQGALALASQCYRRAVDLTPSAADAWQSLARSALARRQPAEALEAANRWLSLDSDASTAHGMRADALRRLGHKTEALEAAKVAVALRDDDPMLWQVNGWALIDTGHYTEAVDAFRRALALNRQSSGGLAGLGAALLGSDSPKEALTVFEELSRIDPDCEDLDHNRALTLIQLRQLDEAVQVLRDSISRNPDDGQLHFDLAIAELTLGHHEAGWREYEWRFALGSPGKFSAGIAPRWNSGAVLEGKRVFIASEQGLGDNIQFVRYVPALIAQGAQVTLQVPPRFRGLVEGNWENCDLIVQAPGSSAQFDLRCSLMSLPYLLGIAEPLQMKFPYVRADKTRRVHWRERIGESRTLTVGLAWAGNPNFSGDAKRSIPLELFREHAPDGIRFVSLQFEIRESDQAARAAWPSLLHFGAEQRDLADTAALIETLDAVVCVDTSIAHLSGALGIPVYILLQYCPDWRWQLDREDTPWYSSARLIRQDASRHWAPVIMRVMEMLCELADAKEIDNRISGQSWPKA